MRENLEIRNYSVNDDGFKVGIPQEDQHIGNLAQKEYIKKSFLISHNLISAIIIKIPLVVY